MSLRTLRTALGQTPEVWVSRKMAQGIKDLSAQSLLLPPLSPTPRSVCSPGMAREQTVGSLL